jgi:hypothetical protein
VIDRRSAATAEGPHRYAALAPLSAKTFDSDLQITTCSLAAA